MVGQSPFSQRSSAHTTIQTVPGSKECYFACSRLALALFRLLARNLIACYPSSTQSTRDCDGRHRVCVTNLNLHFSTLTQDGEAETISAFGNTLHIALSDRCNILPLPSPRRRAYHYGSVSEVMACAAQEARPASQRENNPSSIEKTELWYQYDVPVQNSRSHEIGWSALQSKQNGDLRICCVEEERGAMYLKLYPGTRNTAVVVISSVAPDDT